MQMQHPEFVRTADGSVTCEDKVTGELYHNRAGAYTEALENYIEPARAVERLERQGSLRVLDVCFGLGYNSFVLMQKIIEAGVSGEIEMIGIDIDAGILLTLPTVLSDVRLAAAQRSFDRVPSAFGDYRAQSQNVSFKLSIIQADLREFCRTLEATFDFVFHDGFSPNKVPQLWTVDVFRNYYRALSGRKGLLLTYSAAGAVRGGLREAGFKLYRTQAVGAKGGGTLGCVDSCYEPTGGVFRLTDDELRVLGSKKGVPYRDENLNAARADILRRRAAEQTTY